MPQTFRDSGFGNSPSKEGVHRFTYCHLHSTEKWVGGSGKPSIWSVLGWPRVSSVQKRPHTETGRRWAGKRGSHCFIVSFPCVWSWLLLIIKVGGLKTRVFDLSPVSFIQIYFSSLLTSTSCWSASLFPVMSLERKSQKGTTISAKFPLATFTNLGVFLFLGLSQSWISTSSKTSTLQTCFHFLFPRADKNKTREKIWQFLEATTSCS